jgi:olefin beta-lactone synthetase
LNIASHLGRLASERAALVEPGGRQVSFQELEDRTAALAGGLHGLGLSPGERMLLLVPMSIELYEALIGLFRAGLPVVLLDPSAPTVAENLGRVGLSGFVGSAKAHLLRLKLKELRGLKRYLSTGFTPLPHRRLARVAGPALAPVDVGADDPALLTFTTGSTGRPKTVARSHAFLEAQRSILTEHMGLGPDDIDLPTLPVFLLNSLAAGATCILPDADLRQVASVDPDRVIRQMLKHGCTSTSGSPAFYAPIADRLLEQKATLPGLNKLFTGGARVPAELLHKLVQVAPNARIEVVYGSTEAEPIASIGAREVLDDTAAGEREGRGSCVGRAVEAIDLRICTPGTLDKAGHIGEVCVSGAHVNQGYYEDPESDAENKLREGDTLWHRTGDTGYVDEEGRIWLVGRVKDMVGDLHPFMVEPVAETRAHIQRAALVEVEGRAVLACEVLEPPQHWAEELAERTGADQVVQVSRIPLDPRHNAKVDRNALRAVLKS